MQKTIWPIQNNRMALRFPISFSLAIKRSFYCSNSCFSSTLQQQSVVCSLICSLSSIQDIQIMWNWWWHLHIALKFEKKYNKRYECIKIKLLLLGSSNINHIQISRSPGILLIQLFRDFVIFSQNFTISKVITSFFFVWPGTILFQSFFCVFHSCFSIQRFKKNRVTHKCKSLSLEFTPLTVHKIRNSWKYSFLSVTTV